MNVKMTGAEKLRCVVNWIDYQNETFNDRFTVQELIALWEFGRQHEAEVNEFADTWTEEQIAAALAPLRQAET